jgi:PTH1 family peptidyl-tRNA hydrolase
MKPSLIIIGLGNPGKSYEKTRHNIGFRALDELSKEFGEGDWQEKDKFQAIVKEARILAFPILLVKPLTYMNDSGKTVKKLIDFYKLDPKTQIIVLCDDIDLPLAEIRFRAKGGPGTHNGLRSIVQECGEEFARFRIGLGQGPKGEELAAWVLSVPQKEETEALDAALQSLPGKVREVVLNAPLDEEAAA